MSLQARMGHGGVGGGRSEGPNTCVGFEVLWSHHDYKSDGPLVSEHLVGPPADGAHALHGGDAIVGNEHLDREKEEGARAAHLPATEAACHLGVHLRAAEAPAVPGTRISSVYFYSTQCGAEQVLGVCGLCKWMIGWRDT